MRPWTSKGYSMRISVSAATPCEARRIKRLMAWAGPAMQSAMHAAGCSRFSWHPTGPGPFSDQVQRALRAAGFNPTVEY